MENRKVKISLENNIEDKKMKNEKKLRMENRTKWSSI